MTPTCPFTPGQTIRNTATGETGRVHTAIAIGLPAGWIAVTIDGRDERYVYAWPLMLTELATEAA